MESTQRMKGTVYAHINIFRTDDISTSTVVQTDICVSRVKRKVGIERNLAMSVSRAKSWVCKLATGSLTQSKLGRLGFRSFEGLRF